MPKDRGEYPGEYIGAENLFIGKMGIIKPFGGTVKMQFDDGPDWMTESWITFPRTDVAIDMILNIDFYFNSILTEEEEGSL